MAEWQLQEAKARFSEIVNLAQTNGPQTITRRGRQAAVVLSMEEWRKMLPSTRAEAPAKRLSNEDFLKLLQSSPDFKIPDRHESRSRRAKR